MKRSHASLPVLDEGDFYESIDTAIAQKRHVEQLREYKREFEQYKKVFSEAFIPIDTRHPEVFTFRVVYELKRPLKRTDDIDIMPLLIDQRGVGPEQYPNIFE